MAELERQLLTLAEAYGLIAIYAFGSRAAEFAARVKGASGDSGPRAESDLDIGIQLPRGKHLSARQKVNLTLALEELFDLPRVDLVVCNEAPPFLAQEIVSGELLGCTDLDAQAEYELYVLRRAGDLAPFEYERRRMILEEGAR